MSKKLKYAKDVEIGEYVRIAGFSHKVTDTCTAENGKDIVIELQHLAMPAVRNELCFPRNTPMTIHTL